MTVYRRVKPKSTLIKEFREHVPHQDRPKKLINDVLLPMAQAYETLVGQSYRSDDPETDAKVNELIKWLRRIEWADWVPPALAFLVDHGEDPDSALRFFRRLERLAFGLMIMRAGAYERMERFGKVTERVLDEELLFTKGSPLALTPEEQARVYAVLDGPIYENLNARSRTAILLRLDALLSDSDASYNTRTISVEHVLPQNPPEDSEWLSAFKSRSKRVRLTHRLGNLVLLNRKKNSKASNYDFARKKDAYFFSKSDSTPFVITNEVRDIGRWTPSVVEQRQARLMKKLEKHWRLADRVTVTDDEEEEMA